MFYRAVRRPLLPYLWPLLLLLSVTPGFAGPRGQDSLCFARFSALQESGKGVEAQGLLHGVGQDASSCTQPMAHFLLAWQAYDKLDPAGVVLYLEQGVPEDLADYAEWVRAEALRKTGKPELARAHWERLAGMEHSVFYPQALLELSYLLRDSLPPAQTLALVDRHARSGAPAVDRQKLALLAAEVLTQQKRHSEAVDRLWAALSLAPATGEAGQIRRALSGYQATYGYKPRAQLPAEVAAEFAAFDEGKHYSAGLKRADALLKSGSAHAHAELLTFYRGRFLTGLGRHHQAITAAEEHLRRFPEGAYQYRARFHMGRSAYLTDQDGIAVPSLELAGKAKDDPETAAAALDLLGLLHLDRNRPQEAAAAHQQAAEFKRGAPDEADYLWKLARAQWEAGRMAESAETFRRLYDLNVLSEYAAAGRYWSSRAAGKAGLQGDAAVRTAELMALYPYSYYAVVAKAEPNPDQLTVRPLVPPTLDDIWNTGSEHSRKFAMLAAMRLTDLALREWPLAAQELGPSDGFVWWKVQLHLWDNDRSAAWRVMLAELGPYLRSEGPRPPDFQDAAYPLRYEAQIRRLANKYNVDPYFVFGLICQESHFNPGAVSPVGAIGLMQLMPATARIEAKRLGLKYARGKLYDPDFNLQLGIAHLGRLFEMLGRDTVLVLAAYNAGKNAAERWQRELGTQERDVFIERIPYRETRLFVKRNIEHQAAYRRLYPDRQTAAPLRSATRNP